jgi:M6 family metalloprotease-like protein
MMVAASNKWRALGYAGIIVMLALSAIWFEGVQAGEPSQEGVQPDKVLLPFILGTGTSDTPSAQPADADAQAGQGVSLSGHFLVIWGDQEAGKAKADKKSSEVYTFSTGDGLTVELLIEEKLLRRYGGSVALNREEVTVEGEWVVPPAPERGTPILEVKKIKLVKKQVAPEGTEAPAAVRPGEAVMGAQPWVSLLCKFADIATQAQPVSYFRGMYGDAYPRLGHFWREVSYDNISVAGSSAFGWYTLPHPRSYYVYDQDGDGGEELEFQRAFDDCTAVADPYVYFPNYVGVNLMFNYDLNGFAWGGSAYGVLDGVGKSWRTTWEPPWGWENLSAMMHEMGHGFGFPHSSGHYGNVYDNPWDIMSDIWYNCDFNRDPVYGCVGQGTIAYHKVMGGWIPAARQYTVPRGEATINLERLSQPQTQNSLVAIVPIGSSQEHYYMVEARRLVGYDGKLPGNAVVVHEVDGGQPLIVDADNNGNNGDAGTMWSVGETFHGLNEIEIRVESQTPSGYVVHINNPVEIPPDLVVDTIKFDPSTPAVGQPVNISIQISNQGAQPVTSGFWLDLYVGRVPAGCGDYSDVYAWVDSMAAGEVRSITFSHTFTTQGSQTVSAFADSLCTIAESREDNNIKSVFPNVAAGVIFADSFESGNLSRWSSCVTDVRDLAVTTQAKLAGNYGMQATLDDNVSIYCTDNSPNGELRYHATFRFDPNSIAMAGGDMHRIFYGYSGNSKVVLRVEFRFSSGKYQLRVALLNDGTTWSNSGWFTITDMPHAIELDWKAAKAAGANDGSLTFWIDGVQKARLAGFDNDTQRIDRVRLGALTGIDTGTRGTYFFDAFESRRDSAIGLSADEQATIATATEGEPAELQGWTEEEDVPDEAGEERLLLPAIKR